MIKHGQTIYRQQPTNCLIVFDHFVGLAFKRLSSRKFCTNPPIVKVSSQNNKCIQNLLPHYQGKFTSYESQNTFNAPYIWRWNYLSLCSTLVTTTLRRLILTRLIFTRIFFLGCKFDIFCVEFFSPVTKF